ncbi:MAG TPA: ABC transporter permease [Gaiellaceae bacterium]|jgi:peptide/nickel transport system permease protein|nr:ABC transporter permease [Gaiellaceae bacterium]
MTTAPAAELLTRDPSDFEEPRRRRHAVWSVIRTQPQATIGAIVLLAFVVVAALAPYIAPYDERAKVGDVFEAPSSEHWLGLDDAGVDMLTLMLHGARVSLIVGFAAALVSMLIGGTIGLVAGYFGGKTDVALMRLTDYFIVIPDIPLMLVVAAIWGRSLTNIILIIGLIYWTTTARVIRAQVKSVRERVYVKRARALGAGHLRVLFKHVLPQVAPLLVAITVLSIAVAIFAETAIAFLGLGDPTLISWGRLIENAFSRSAISVDAWWAVVPPGLAVVAVVLACTMLGRALEDSLNPRLRVGHLSVRHFRLRNLRTEEAR